MSSVPGAPDRPPRDWLRVSEPPPDETNRQADVPRSPAASPRAADAVRRVTQAAAWARTQFGRASSWLTSSGRAAFSGSGRIAGSAAGGAIGRAFLAIRRRGSVSAWRAVGLGAAIVVLPIVAFLLYCLLTIPRDGGMAAEPSPPAIVMTAAGGEPLATRGTLKGDKLAATTLPANLRKAIVAIEDRRFYSHWGIDGRGLGRALFRNASGGREGASTITQQYARLLYLSQERSLRRKVQEAMLALWLEDRLSKDEILAGYLNSAYFGGGAYGADAASRRFFGKPAAELDLPEAAMLAGLVRAPSSLAPHRNLEGARARADLVLGAMQETGAITPQEADEARRNPASVWEPPGTAPGTGYFVDMVEAETRRLATAPDADVAATTTLDLRLQSAAERIVARMLDAEGRQKGVSQAALVALAPDGAILAMVGGRSYPDSQFNRALQAKRQPGSLFKLFVYLTALQKGADPQSVVVDRPVQIGDWEPENYGGGYRGPMTLRTAFAQSVNTVAVQLATGLGLDAVTETARSLGVSSDLPKVPSLALGAAEVTLMEMTRAYAAVAAGVGHVEPYGVTRVARRSENLFRREPAKANEPADPDARANMLDLLLAVVQEGSGRAARLPNVPVGGKTGTTQDSRDAWFVGFTPAVTIGVWVGNDDNSPMKGVTGGDLPARIWKAVATEALRSRPRAEVRAPAPKPAQPRGMAAARPADVQPDAPSVVEGVPSVRDTGTLDFDGAPIRLAGIQGIGGRAARDLARYLRRRPVSCAPDSEAQGAYRCLVDGQDLSRVVLFNGGARATPEASSELREAEDQARSAAIGVWGR